MTCWSAKRSCAKACMRVVFPEPTGPAKDKAHDQPISSSSPATDQTKTAIHVPHHARAE